MSRENVYGENLSPLRDLRGTSCVIGIGKKNSWSGSTEWISLCGPPQSRNIPPSCTALDSDTQEDDQHMLHPLMTQSILRSQSEKASQKEGIC